MRIFWIVFIVTLSILGCKDKHEDIVPNVIFSGTLDLSSPDYLVSPFLARTDMLGQPLGIAGIVVYSLTSETYYTYDRMCPHERSTGSLVILIKGESAMVKCPTCGSKFLLNGGFGDVVNGPATYPLKAYSNKYEPSDNTLSVWN